MGWLRPYPTKHCGELRHGDDAVAGITDDFHILADAMRNAPALFNVLRHDNQVSPYAICLNSSTHKTSYYSVG